MTIPPKYAIADVMGRLKSQSSSHLRVKFPWLKKVYLKENVSWSRGYFVSSVVLDEERIKRYVEFQGRQDLGQPKWSCKEKAPVGAFSEEPQVYWGISIVH